MVCILNCIPYLVNPHALRNSDFPQSPQTYLSAQSSNTGSVPEAVNLEVVPTVSKAPTGYQNLGEANPQDLHRIQDPHQDDVLLYRRG
jgi:hypothetical protein